MALTDKQDATTPTRMRRASLAITPELAACMMKTLNGGPRSYEVIENALPDDATVVDVFFDTHRRCVVFVLESEAFPVVRAGEWYTDLPSPVLSVS